MLHQESFSLPPPSPASHLPASLRSRSLLPPPSPSSAQEDPLLHSGLTYHKDEDSEFGPVQLGGHLPGNAVLPVGPLPHLPLHKAAIQAPAGAARALASHFGEVTLDPIDLGQGIGCKHRRESRGRKEDSEIQRAGVPAQAALSAPQEIRNSEMTELQPPAPTVSIHLLTHAAIHTLTHSMFSNACTGHSKTTRAYGPEPHLGT